MVSHRNLKPARLPVSPHPHNSIILYLLKKSNDTRSLYRKRRLKPPFFSRCTCYFQRNGSTARTACNSSTSHRTRSRRRDARTRCSSGWNNSRTRSSDFSARRSSCAYSRHIRRNIPPNAIRVPENSRNADFHAFPRNRNDCADCSFRHTK